MTPAKAAQSVASMVCSYEMLLAAALGGQTREFRCERAHLAASELELTRQSPRQQEQSDANKC